ncbi:recombinase family protein [soil metagenome]
MIRVAFYGRVSTEDQQDPVASKGWQLRRAKQLVEPHGGNVVQEFFDIGMSRSLPWKRRAEAKRLLDALGNPDRGFEAVVIGEPQRAFYGNQFGLTFPVFTHYGVQLWVPEVGGAIDPGSEAHDMVMMLFGGMSKGERTRVQVRTRAAMQDLASTTNRFLGGRPPYGYQLTDAGPHPNPGRAATGQRAHHLEPDPVTAPVVREIFELFSQGQGLRTIAQRLTDDGLPSPSEHDPRRNSHRDTRGWAYSTVRAILQNEVYTGVRVWGKQEKFETLIDPDDVAAGYETRMRWREEDSWVRPAAQTHPALISKQRFAIVRGLMVTDAPSLPRSRRSVHPYQLRGLLVCVHCGRRMQGAWRANRAEGSAGRVLYRCGLRNMRSIPPELSDHPKSLYVREDHILPPLDAWIAKLTSPEGLESGQPVPPGAAAHASLRQRIGEIDRKIKALLTAIENGTDIFVLTEQLSRRTREREGLLAQLRATDPAPRVTTEQIATALEDLGGISTVLAKADPADKAKLYGSLGIKLEYDYSKLLVRATAAAACVPERVRRGT